MNNFNYLKQQYKYKNYIISLFILKIIKGKIISQGQSFEVFLKKFYLLIRESNHFHVSLLHFLTYSILNITPFLTLYKAKANKRSKRKIEKVKHISILAGIKLSINWIFYFIGNSKSFDLFVKDFFFELCDAFYKTGRIYQKKLDHYQACLDTRFFIK